jgi:hypothetical protein
MKTGWKTLLLFVGLLFAVSFVFAAKPASPGSGNDCVGNDKVDICHKGKTLTVSSCAIPGHLGHGDTLGACGIPPPNGNGTGNGTGNNTGNQTNNTGNGTGNNTGNVTGNYTAFLTIKPPFPQNMSYVFECTAVGFVPAVYDWTYGNGQFLNGVVNDNTMHNYTTPGNYTVTCTPRNGTVNATAYLNITVIPT